MVKSQPPIYSMTTEDMDKDLERFTDFEQMSERVSYWSRRFALTKPTDAQSREFDDVVSKHSLRALGILRAG